MKIEVVKYDKDHKMCDINQVYQKRTNYPKQDPAELNLDQIIKKTTEKSSNSKETSRNASYCTVHNVVF